MKDIKIKVIENNLPEKIEEAKIEWIIEKLSEEHSSDVLKLAIKKISDNRL